MTDTAAPLLALHGLKKQFDIPPPLLNRVLERRPVQHLRLSTASTSRSRAARPSAWSATWLRQVHRRAAGRRSLRTDERTDLV